MDIPIAITAMHKRIVLADMSKKERIGKICQPQPDELLNID